MKVFRFNCVPLVLLVVLAIVVLGASRLFAQKEALPFGSHMSLSDYLASAEFTGVVLSRPLNTPAPKGLRRLIPVTAYRTNGDKVRIRFNLNRPKVFGPGGQFTMDYGQHRVTGGWNVASDVVEMGVDKVDGRPHLGEPTLIFQPPREAGEPFVIGDFFSGGPQAKITGLLVVNIANYANSVQSYENKSSGVRIDFESTLR